MKTRLLILLSLIPLHVAASDSPPTVISFSPSTFTAKAKRI